MNTTTPTILVLGATDSIGYAVTANLSHGISVEVCSSVCEKQNTLTL